MDAFEAIGRRISTRTFLDRPVERATIARLLAAAVRAPNHKLTEPWRFAVLTGVSRDRYADIRRTHRAARFADAQAPEAVRAVDRTWREARETPAFVVVLCARSDDPVRREEDLAATWMAVENLLVAATADGLGSYVRTGGILRERDLLALVGASESHTPIAVVSLGWPADPGEAPRRRTPAAEKTVWLE